MSSFCGKIRELPDVSVDNFTDLSSSAYFLSHCHADHMEGLFSPQLLEHLRADDVYIYMSEPSAAIVRHQSEGSDLTDYIRPLPVGTTVVGVRGSPLWEESPQAVSVTLVPAAHCWGSVMLLLESLYATVLYTGDARLASPASYPQLLDHAGDLLDIDALYVDTTFYSAEYRELAARARCVAAAHEHVRAWLARGGARGVALHVSARYGYEFVFNAVWDHFHTKVFVPPHAWSLYSQFPEQIRGVSNEPSSTRFHLCQNRSERQAHAGCVPEPGARYLFVHYSAMRWRHYQPGDDVVRVAGDDQHPRIDVCFATHSSLSEIEHFVACLRPRRVCGFPNPYPTPRPGDAQGQGGTPQQGGTRQREGTRQQDETQPQEGTSKQEGSHQQEGTQQWEGTQQQEGTQQEGGTQQQKGIMQQRKLHHEDTREPVDVWGRGDPWVQESERDEEDSCEDEDSWDEEDSWNQEDVSDEGDTEAEGDSPDQGDTDDNVEGGDKACGKEEEEEECRILTEEEFRNMLCHDVCETLD